MAITQEMMDAADPKSASIYASRESVTELNAMLFEAVRALNQKRVADIEALRAEVTELKEALIQKGLL